MPKLNERMLAEDIVTQETVAEKQRRWNEQGAEINRQLKKEAFEKAIRAAMRLICVEVVLAVVADVAAEGDFVHYWAHYNAGSLIVDALLHPSYVESRNNKVPSKTPQSDAAEVIETDKLLLWTCRRTGPRSRKAPFSRASTRIGRTSPPCPSSANERTVLHTTVLPI